MRLEREDQRSRASVARALHEQRSRYQVVMRNSTCSLLGLLGTSLLVGCPDQHEQAYEQTNLLSDRADVARNVDPDLVDPSGIASGPETSFWIANAGSSTLTIADGRGEIVGTVETRGAPTDIVYNPTAQFQIRLDVAPNASIVAPSTFLFATEEGQIFGWSAFIDPKRTIMAVDESDSGANYQGLAIASIDTISYIYATDFQRGKIDVFEGLFFTPAAGLDDDAFVDPTLPSGYAPFGISTLGNRLYVTYAEQDAAREYVVAEPGAGYIDVFEPSGRFVRRLASRGELNAPWAVVRAPSDFGVFGDALLVGNSGDGRILALDPDDGTLLGPLEDRNGEPIAIEGLRGLTFGNDRLAGRSNSLYFTAGIDDGEHGLYGRVSVAR